MKNISCLIVEDEPHAAQLIARYIERIPFLTCCKICYNGYEALTYLKNVKVDLIFLDIHLPELSGLDIATMLGPDQKIIFTTAYAEHALNSFDFFVVDYLLKPITFKRFMQAALKAQEILETKEENSPYFYLKNGHLQEKIYYDDILYIEGMKEYACMHTVTGIKLMYKRMKNLSDTLSRDFLRVHNSYIVNTKQISSIKNNRISISNKEIPVSLSYRKAVKRWLSEHQV